METTKEFIAAVEKGSQSLREKAREAERMPVAEQDGRIGDLVRESIEKDHQTADLLDGWLVRARKELGIPPPE